MNYRAVLFDFDYTLADSSRGIEDCANHALAELGLPAASARAVSETVGLSLAETFCRLAAPPHRSSALNSRATSSPAPTG